MRRCHDVSTRSPVDGATRRPLLQVFAKMGDDQETKDLFGRREPGKRDFAGIDADHGGSRKLDLHDRDVVFSSLEQMGTAVNLADLGRSYVKAALLFQLARPSLLRGLACPGIAAGQSELFSIGILDDQDLARVPDRHQRSSLARAAHGPVHPEQPVGNPVSKPVEMVYRLGRCLNGAGQDMTLARFGHSRKLCVVCSDGSKSPNAPKRTRPTGMRMLMKGIAHAEPRVEPTLRRQPV